jgi:2-hydroxy-6-oxonona-2,4-dienedioate hydrolase/4,5:9,10-diseco-3-hydroxy-5,9,17-trioxoandrosta-1(10),2-diene-4-oate hydrolase
VVANPVLTRSRPFVLEPLWKDLDKIQHMTLLIGGRDERTVTLDNAFIMLQRLPDVRLHVFGKCGHWAQWEKAAEFNRLVLDFPTVGE